MCMQVRIVKLCFEIFNLEACVKYYVILVQAPSISFPNRGQQTTLGQRGIGLKALVCAKVSHKHQLKAFI